MKESAALAISLSFSCRHTVQNRLVSISSDGKAYHNCVTRVRQRVIQTAIQFSFMLFGLWVSWKNLIFSCACLWRIRFLNPRKVLENFTLALLRATSIEKTRTKIPSQSQAFCVFEEQMPSVRTQSLLQLQGASMRGSSNRQQEARPALAESYWRTACCKLETTIIFISLNVTESWTGWCWLTFFNVASTSSRIHPLKAQSSMFRRA